MHNWTDIRAAIDVQVKRDDEAEWRMIENNTIPTDNSPRMIGQNLINPWMDGPIVEDPETK